MKILILIFALTFLVKDSIGVPPLISQILQEIENEEGVHSKGEEESKIIQRYRLPNSTYPINYKLDVQIVLDEGTEWEQFTAPSIIEIDIRCAEVTNGIILHMAVGMIIEEIKLFNSDDDNTEIEVTGHTHDAVKEFLSISLNEELVVNGNYKIWIKYIAEIQTTIDLGLYRSFYNDEDGNLVNLAGTDFQATDGRKAFPCYDEPQLKATWEISVVRMAKYISLSNMDLYRIQEEIPDMPGWHRDYYRVTPVPLSTYLVAFAVCDFLKEDASPEYYHSDVTVWGPPTMMRQGAGLYAPDVSAKLMKAHEDMYNVIYDFPKMDKIALPHFAAGAMENWGLNTYRLARLLWIEGESTWAEKVIFTNTISHEIVHQWFGNRVTCFATYFATVGVDKVMPHFLLKESFIFNSVQNSMQADANPTAHPIHYYYDDPLGIRAMFSTITYHKGGSVLRMISAFLGETSFLNGLNKYLLTPGIDNGVAHQDDLFEALQIQAIEDGSNLGDHTMKEILDTWTLQSQFPVVRVNRDFSAGSATFKQERFYREYPSESPDDKSWIIPVSYMQERDALDISTKFWMTNDSSAEHVESGLDDDKFFLVNPTTTGFFRVLYNQENLDRIIDSIIADHNSIDPQIKSQLFDDQINLVQAGYETNIESFLRLSTYLKDERSLMPWASFLINLGRFTHRMIAKTSTFYYYRQHLLSLIKPAIEEIGYIFVPGDENEVGNKILLRNYLFDWACNLGDRNCINVAKETMNNWIENSDRPQEIFPDQQPLTYCHAVANGGDKVWNFVFEQYKTFTRHMLPETMHTNLIRALGCVKEPFRLKQLLSMVIDTNSGIRTSDRMTAISAVAGNSNGGELTLNFIKENYRTMIQVLGQNSFTSAISTLSNNLNTEFDALSLEKFLNDNSDELESMRNSIESSIRNIRSNVKWMQDHFPAWAQWLNNNAKF